MTTFTKGDFNYFNWNLSTNFWSGLKLLKLTENFQEYLLQKFKISCKKKASERIHWDYDKFLFIFTEIFIRFYSRIFLGHFFRLNVN